jgi:hypothetical protein
VNFMSGYIKLHGDHHPHQNKTTLPFGRTYLQVHAVYKADALEYGIQTPYSYNYFTVVLKEAFPHLALQSRSEEFKCSTCHEIEDRLEVARIAHDELSVQRLKSEYEAHQDFACLQRQKYTKHKQKARNTPDKYMCMIIDGMDQSKMIVPNLKGRGDVSDFKADLPQLHLTSARMADGHTYSYFNWDNIAKDGSAIPNILCRVLASQKAARGGKLAEVLYIQLDNTCRENKNRYVFAFLSLLVQQGVFRKIKVNFLLVGHTHEDVDQGFFQYSYALGRDRPATGPAILAAIETVTTHTVEVEMVEDMVNTRDWLDAKICKESLADFQGPLQWRFCLTPAASSGYSPVMTELCSVQCKPAAGSDTPYSPLGGGGVLLKGEPEGDPFLINLRPIMCASGEQLAASLGDPAVWTKKIEKIKSIISKLFEKGYLRPDPHAAKSWWEDFLSRQLQLITDGITGCGDRVLRDTLDARVSTVREILDSKHVGPWTVPVLANPLALRTAAERTYGLIGFTERCILPSSRDATLPETDNVLDLLSVNVFIVLPTSKPSKGRHPTLGTIAKDKRFKLVNGADAPSPTCFVYVGQVLEILGVSNDRETATCVVHWWGPARGTSTQWEPLHHIGATDGTVTTSDVGCDRGVFDGEAHKTEQDVSVDGLAAVFLRWDTPRLPSRAADGTTVPSIFTSTLPLGIVYTVKRRAVVAQFAPEPARGSGGRARGGPGA